MFALDFFTLSLFLEKKEEGGKHSRKPKKRKMDLIFHILHSLTSGSTLIKTHQINNNKKKQKRKETNTTKRTANNNNII